MAANDRHRPYQRLAAATRAPGLTAAVQCQSHWRLAGDGRVQAGRAAAVRAASSTVGDVVVSGLSMACSSAQSGEECLPRGLVQLCWREKRTWNWGPVGRDRGAMAQSLVPGAGWACDAPDAPCSNGRAAEKPPAARR